MIHISTITFCINILEFKATIIKNSMVFVILTIAPTIKLLEALKITEF